MIERKRVTGKVKAGKDRGATVARLAHRGQQLLGELIERQRETYRERERDSENRKRGRGATVPRLAHRGQQRQARDSENES